MQVLGDHALPRFKGCSLLRPVHFIPAAEIQLAVEVRLPLVLRAPGVEQPEADVDKGEQGEDHHDPEHYRTHLNILKETVLDHSVIVLAVLAEVAAKAAEMGGTQLLERLIGHEA